MGDPVTVKELLLQALVSGDSYGLELIERTGKKHPAGTVRLHQGNTYPALRSLEREGLLESYEGEATPERGGRPRRYYRLTRRGLEAARKLEGAPAVDRASREEKRKRPAVFGESPA